MFDLRCRRWVYILILSPIYSQLAKIEKRLLRAIKEVSEKLDEQCLGNPGFIHWPCVRAELSGERFIVEGELLLVQLKDTEKVKLQFGAPVDAKGKPAKVQDGSITFSVENDTGTVVADPDNGPFACEYSAGDPTPDIGAPGAVIIEGDADLGEGVRKIQGAEPVIVLTGDAVGFGPATVGTPEPQ